MFINHNCNCKYLFKNFHNPLLVVMIQNYEIKSYICITALIHFFFFCTDIPCLYINRMYCSGAEMTAHSSFIMTPLSWFIYFLNMLSHLLPCWQQVRTHHIRSGALHWHHMFHQKKCLAYFPLKKEETNQLKRANRKDDKDVGIVLQR